MPEIGESWSLQIPTAADRALWLPRRSLQETGDFLSTLLPPETDGYGTGLLTPPSGLVAPSALLVPRIRAQMEVGSPDSADNSLFVEGVYNQGSTPKCSSYSASGILSALKRKQHGPGNWWRFNADLLFQEGGGTDQGGIMQSMDTVLDRSGGLRLDDQRRYKEMSWAQVPNVVGVWEEAVCAALAAGGFIHQALLLPQGFGSATTGPMTSGYHAIFLTGYRKQPKLQFRLMNSWGAGFGQGGFAWIDADYLSQQGFQHNYAYSLTLVDAVDAGIDIPPTPTPGGAVQQILDLTNQARAQNGLGPLKLQSQLTAAAQGYAIQLAANIPFSHTGPDGSTPFSRMHAAGYTGPIMGENIARGFPDANSVFAAWMNSPGHKANILYPQYTQIGIGVAGSGGLMSWVQDFGAGGTDDGGPPPPPPPTPVGLTLTVNASPTAIGGTPSRAMAAGTQVTITALEPGQAAVSASATVGGIPPPPPPPPPPGGPTIDLTAPEPVTAGGTLTIRGSGFGSGTGRVVFYPGPVGRINFWSDSMVQVFVPATAGRGPNQIELDTANGLKVNKIITVS